VIARKRPIDPAKLPSGCSTVDLWYRETHEPSYRTRLRNYAGFARDGRGLGDRDLGSNVILTSFIT
jgi:hypothetical protein